MSMHPTEHSIKWHTLTSICAVGWHFHIRSRFSKHDITAPWERYSISQGDLVDEDEGQSAGLH